MNHSKIGPFEVFKSNHIGDSNHIGQSNYGIPTKIFYNNTKADNLIQNSKGAGMLYFSRQCTSYFILFF